MQFAGYSNTVLNLRFFIGYGLELSRIVPLIIFHIKRKFLCKTERDVKEAWLPGELGYATKVPTDLLILTIVMCYSVIAPLIIPFGAIYFGLGWLVFRNQVRPLLSIMILVFVLSPRHTHTQKQTIRVCITLGSDRNSKFHKNLSNHLIRRGYVNLRYRSSSYSS